MTTSQRAHRLRRHKSDRSNLIDLQIGSRVRLRRNMLDLSQVELGEAIGVSFQQVQKYEKGASCIAVSRLHSLSRVLGVPVSFFFENIEPVRARTIPKGRSKPPSEALASDPLRWPETIELADAYYAIDDSTVRRRLLELVKALGSPPSPPPNGNEGKA